MNNIWTMPFDFLKDQPADIAERLREYDLKARIYQAMGKYWTKMFSLLNTNKSQSKLKDEATAYTQGLYDDLLKVFNKFKEGEDYNSLNLLEKFGDRVAKQVHKLVLGSDIVGDKALKEIQECLETLWDDLLNLKAGDRAGFDELMTVFAFETWAAMGLSVKEAPVFGIGTAGNQKAAKEGTVTNEGKVASEGKVANEGKVASEGTVASEGKVASEGTAASEKTSRQEMKLVGKGAVVYCPVVLPKRKVQAMIPGSVMSLESIGRGLPKNNHLVIFALARQTIDFGNGQTTTYQEAFPIIPNVKVPGENRLFQAVPVIWVSNLEIAKGARDYWKLNKLYANFSELVNFPVDVEAGLRKCSNDVKVSVENENGGFSETVALSSKIESTGLTKQDSKSYDHFALFQKLLAAPMIYWQGSDFYIADFNIDFETSKIAGASTQLKTGDLYGMGQGGYIVDSIEKNVLGSFELDYDWVFLPPRPYQATLG